VPEIQPPACPAVSAEDYEAKWLINPLGSCESEGSHPVASRASGPQEASSSAPTAAEQAGNSGQQNVKADDKGEENPVEKWLTEMSLRRLPPGLEVDTECSMAARP